MQTNSGLELVGEGVGDGGNVVVGGNNNTSPSIYPKNKKSFL